MKVDSLKSLSLVPAIKIEDIIKFNGENTVAFDLSKLEIEGMTKIINPLNLEDDDIGIYIIFKNNY